MPLIDGHFVVDITLTNDKKTAITPALDWRRARPMN